MMRNINIANITIFSISIILMIASNYFVTEGIVFGIVKFASSVSVYFSLLVILILIFRSKYNKMLYLLFTFALLSLIVDRFIITRDWIIIESIIQNSQKGILEGDLVVYKEFNPNNIYKKMFVLYKDEDLIKSGILKENTNECMSSEYENMIAIEREVKIQKDNIIFICDAVTISNIIGEAKYIIFSSDWKRIGREIN